MLFVACSGSLILHIASAIESEIKLIPGLAWTISGPSYALRPMDIGISVTCYVVVYFLAYFFFGRKGMFNSQLHFRGVRVLLITLVVVFADIALDMLVSFYLADSVTIVKGLIYALGFLVSLLTLFIQYDILVAKQANQRLESEREHWNKSKHQYELNKQTIDLINIKCHDLRHRLRDNVTLAGEHKDIDNLLSVYESDLATGLEPLDVLFNEKALYCRENQIHLLVMADGPALSFLDPTDAYTLFDNILDNAISAVKELPNERNIVLNIVRKNSFVLIHEENAFKTTFEIENGLPKTSSKDTENHGFGMKSIAQMVKQYGGGLSIGTSPLFTLDIVLPIPEEKRNCGTRVKTKGSFLRKRKRIFKLITFLVWLHKA